MKRRLITLSAAAVLVLAVADTAVGQESFRVDLQADLVVGEATGATFGTQLHVDVATTGAIVVGDWMSSTIQIFSEDGGLRQVLGRPGGGPGEFQGIHQVAVGSNDTIFVLDASARRVTAYAPGDEYTLAYLIRLDATGATGHPFRLFIPRGGTDRMFVAFRNQARGTIGVHQVSREGGVMGRPIFEGRSSESVAAAGGGAAAVSVQRTAPLFARRGIVGMTDSDEFYYAWTEAIELTFYDLDGTWSGVYRATSERVPVTPRDVEYELRDASETRRNILEDVEPPPFKPALRSVIVDDSGWIWTARYTEDPARILWRVHPERGQWPSADSVTLPEHVDIRVIRDGRAYAVSVDEIGYPTVVRFAIEASDVGGQSP